MPAYITANFWVLLQIALTTSCVVGLISLALSRFTFGKETWEHVARLVGLLLGVAIIGAVSGYSGGLSREAAVGDIIPAALALLGGAAAYLFGVNESRGIIASLCAISFAVSLHFGFALGAEERIQHDSHATLREHCLRTFTNPELIEQPNALSAHIGIFGPVCSQVMARLAVDAKFVASSDQGSLATQVENVLDTWKEAPKP